MEPHFLLANPEEILAPVTKLLVSTNTHPMKANRFSLLSSAPLPPLMSHSGSEKVQLGPSKSPWDNTATQEIHSYQWPQLRPYLLKGSKMLRAPVLEPEGSSVNWSQVGHTKQKVILRLFPVMDFEKAVVLGFQRSKGSLLSSLREAS